MDTRPAFRASYRLAGVALAASFALVCSTTGGGGAGTAGSGGAAATAGSVGGDGAGTGRGGGSGGSTSNGGGGDGGSTSTGRGGNGGSTAGAGRGGGNGGSTAGAGRGGGNGGSTAGAGRGGGNGGSTAGVGGAVGGQGGLGRGGASGGRSGAGGLAATACVPADCNPLLASCPCDPATAPCSTCTPCKTCDSGQVRDLNCTCSATGVWSCKGGTLDHCGSSHCEPGIGCSLPSGDTTCEYCDTSGNRGHCQCQATNPPAAAWKCDPPTAGGCGINCGSRTCLDSELCVDFGISAGAGTSGTGGAGGAVMPPGNPTCVPMPQGCNGQPSCSCLVGPFGCEPAPFNGCSQLGTQHFYCLLPGG